MRRIVSVGFMQETKSMSEHILAYCDDGSIWMTWNSHGAVWGDWKQLPIGQIPQDKPEEPESPNNPEVYISGFKEPISSAINRT